MIGPRPRLGLALSTLLSGACARPPTEPPRPREGWLRDVADLVGMRPAEACEREAARAEGESERDTGDGIARAVEADLDGDGSPERVVVALRHGFAVAVTDARCNTLWRGGLDLDGATMAGPSPAADPWQSVPPAEVQRLYATDRLPLGSTNQLFVVRGEGRHRHALVVTRGSLGTLRYGWRALVLSCHAGACAATRVGHVERAAIPSALGCGPTFRPWHTPPDIETPLLRVAPGATPGSLVLTPHARYRDTCGAAPEETRALAPFTVTP